MDSVAPSVVGLESLDKLMTEKFISMTCSSMKLMTVLTLIYCKVYPKHNFLCTNSKFAQDVKLVLQYFQWISRYLNIELLFSCVRNGIL